MPLSLILLAPIVVNIVAFHGVLAPGGMFMPLFCTALGLFVAWGYRSAFAPLFEPRRVADVGEGEAARAIAHAG
ncbi:MAG: hypothetical protein AAFX94_12720 [Myxococcota bacterium]